ncbi:MAG: hypothetical protein AB7M05_08530 [Alphaproteobacteria bacterium]
MRKFSKTLLAAAALVAGLAAAPALYAHDSGNSQNDSGSMMGSGMMGQGSMMNMMGQMSQMMDHCNQMMQGSMGSGSGKPNEQWRKEAPSAPDKNG